MKRFIRRTSKRQPVYRATRAALLTPAIATVGGNDRQHFPLTDAAPVLLNREEIATIAQAIQTDGTADPATVNSILRRFGIIDRCRMIQ